MKTTQLMLPGNAKGVMRTCVEMSAEHYGWLLSPARTMTVYGLYGLPYGVDNEVFTGRFEPGRFVRALQRIKDAHGTNDCRFVVAPDVVANARVTLRLFDRWAAVIKELGFPVALAAQDGLEALPVPWDNSDALFVGGSTEWKMSDAAAGVMWEAKQRGKWVHVGRVSSWLRVDQLKVPPDSVDGTHWAKKPERYFVEWNTELQARLRNQRFEFVQTTPMWEPT